MKKIVMALLLTVPLVAAGYSGYEESRKKAASGGKNLMVYFFREHCPYCEQMDTWVLSDKKVEKAIADNFVFTAVNLDSPAGEKTGLQYRVTVSPSFVFAGPDGSVICIITGSRSADKFLKIIAGAAKGKCLNYG